jgi:DNA-binding response OmpR family regulator
MDKTSIKVLLIEDNPGDVRLMQEMLASVKGIPFHLQSASRLSTGQKYLAGGGIDVVLLDLSLPDSHGLDTFDRIHTQAKEVPIVVLTGTDDEALAVDAAQQGAQDYLVKGQINGQIVARSIRYAIERHRLLAELEQSLHHEQQERERLERQLNAFEMFPDVSPTAVTARTFGLTPLHESVPDTFNELVQHYGDLMELALEQRTYKVEHNISEELRIMAEQLGALSPGPRDIVELHTIALKRKTHEAPYTKTQAYVEEGQLMVLQLMGYLVSFYRNYFNMRGEPQTTIHTKQYKSNDG